MYFLETIEGAKGENFTSAILKYLILNSDGFRRHFLGWIDRRFAASHIPSFKNGVICFTEYAADEEKGFIDLLLIADNAVIGVENKLWAEVQHDQPSKYLETLKRLANERCGGREAFKIVMLVPKQREDEIYKELHDQNVPNDQSIVLDWQEVMAGLQELAREETGEVAFVCQAFVEYLDRCIGDIRINGMPSKLVGDVQIGNVFQQDFLYKVHGVFKNSGRVVAGGKGGDEKWYGFSFELEDIDLKSRPRPWFGFYGKVPKVGLVIQTYLPEFPAPNDGFSHSDYSRQGDVWLAVNCDESDDSVPKWRSKLQPVFDALRESLETASPNS